MDIKIPPKGAQIILGEGVYKVIASRPNGKLTLKLMGRRKPQKKLPISDKEVLKKFDEQKSKEKSRSSSVAGK